VRGRRPGCSPTGDALVLRRQSGRLPAIGVPVASRTGGKFERRPVRSNHHPRHLPIGVGKSHCPVGAAGPTKGGHRDQRCGPSRDVRSHRVHVHVRGIERKRGRHPVDSEWRGEHDSCGGPEPEPITGCTGGRDLRPQNVAALGDAGARHRQPSRRKHRSSLAVNQSHAHDTGNISCGSGSAHSRSPGDASAPGSIPAGRELSDDSDTESAH
jgi:hypothetical protein